jgi:hypothetical protein
MDAGAPRLRQTYGNRLLWRACAVFPFANVFHLLAHELACLSCRGLPLALGLAGPFNGFFLRHWSSRQLLRHDRARPRLPSVAHSSRSSRIAPQLPLHDR